jgi:hypothetical protein
MAIDLIGYHLQSAQLGSLKCISCQVFVLFGCNLLLEISVTLVNRYRWEAALDYYGQL